jgi:hypothetical protein
MAANNLVNTKAELFGTMVQRELLETASLAGLVTDYSRLAIKGSKTVSIPKLSSFTVQSRAFGAPATENAALPDSADSIALDKNKIVFWGYDAADALQSSIEYQMEAASRAASAHGRDVNSEIITEWEAVSGLNINGAVPADITIGNILDMRQFLKQNHADMTQVALVIAADQEKAMLLLPEFSRYDYRGNGAAPVVNGTIGSVYGVPVVINQQVKASQAFMIERSGCGIAFQRTAKFAENSSLKYGTDGKEAAVDQTYGVGGLQLGAGVELDNVTPLGATVSGLVAKLID